ncbi:UNVERIFIED_CONTAM: hypothetical protein GTU68_009624 [Idotea baltica]|nr:hypothetical protein [Idotea baltica]
MLILPQAILTRVQLPSQY